MVNISVENAKDFDVFSYFVEVLYVPQETFNTAQNSIVYICFTKSRKNV